MRYTHFLTALLLIALLSVFAAAQSHMRDHSKMHKSVDTSLVKDTTHVTAKDTYTCPMHPEVISDKRGKCPECGMNLVKVKPSLNIKKSHKMHKDTSMSRPKKTQ